MFPWFLDDLMAHILPREGAALIGGRLRGWLRSKLSSCEIPGRVVSFAEGQCLQATTSKFSAADIKAVPTCPLRLSSAEQRTPR